MKLLEILVCPLCKAKINYDKKHNELVCNKCKLAYPIDDDIPVMLIDSARELE
ncbi:MAG: Trm112 family protein [Burkholderiales bacterium]|nr:Trm112 family protein [Burkholderiales bacterium]